ncbi:hypothetical protein BpHYR1_000713 [Brachionus plicatilis]|uniref:Uncharacterized protein n=1 Tax=Brachionus plicatilis TaxID=10195 RepID=A0A3M7SCM2_BRAPC|nr:hypothetical protein BpHYR1_000713 [Brachionus plicatilis]
MSASKLNNYNKLTMEKKYRLIQVAGQKNSSQRSLAQEFKLSLGAVNKILKQKYDIIEIYKTRLNSCIL